MSNDPSSPDMTNRADYWAQRMADGSDTITDEERAEFNAWLFDNESNEQDYRRAVMVMQLAADLSPAQQSALTSPSGSGHTEHDRVAGRRNVLKFAALAASVAALVVTGALFVEQGRLSSQTYRTATGETQTIKLGEGSVAYLNTRTELRWRGTAKDRRVELVSGEALFDVAHDKARPFTVMLDGSEIRVLGTRFNVYRKSGGDVSVTVLEGTVEVRGFGGSGPNPDWVRTLHARDQLEYRPIGLVGEPRQTDPVMATKWREGLFQLPVKGAPLTVVLDELTRYTDKRIVIRDARLATLNVGGAIDTRDVQAALQKLQVYLPVEVRETDRVYALDYRDSSKERN